MKRGIKIALLVAAAFVVFGFFRDQALKIALTASASRLIGAEVALDSLSMSVLKQSVRLEGLKVYNPAGFPTGVMMDVPEIVVDADMAAFFKGRLRFPYIRLNLKEVSIVKDRQGQLNINALKIVPRAQESQKKDEPTAKPPAIELNVVSLNLGQVVFTDHQKTPPAVTAYPVRVTEKLYRNVGGPHQLVSLVLFEAAKPVAIRGVAVYGGASFLGAAFMPAGIAAIMTGNDSASVSFNTPVGDVYEAAVETAREMGRVRKEDQKGGVISASIQGARVTIHIFKAEGATRVRASARRFMMPQAAVAAGFLAKLGERLKQFPH